MKTIAPKRIWIRTLASGKIAVAEYRHVQRHNILDPFKFNVEESNAHPIGYLRMRIEEFQRLNNNREVIAEVSLHDFPACKVARAIGFNKNMVFHPQTIKPISNHKIEVEPTVDIPQPPWIATLQKDTGKMSFYNPQDKITLQYHKKDRRWEIIQRIETIHEGRTDLMDEVIGRGRSLYEVWKAYNWRLGYKV